MPRISIFHYKRRAKYGFKLSSQRISRTFISENREEILKWFKALINIGIQSRINKFYTFKEIILTNDNYKVQFYLYFKGFCKRKKKGFCNQNIF